MRSQTSPIGRSGLASNKASVPRKPASFDVGDAFSPWPSHHPRSRRSIHRLPILCFVGSRQLGCLYPYQLVPEFASNARSSTARRINTAKMHPAFRFRHMTSPISQRSLTHHARHLIMQDLIKFSTGTVHSPGYYALWRPRAVSSSCALEAWGIKHVRVVMYVE